MSDSMTRDAMLAAAGRFRDAAVLARQKLSLSSDTELDLMYVNLIVASTIADAFEREARTYAHDASLLDTAVDDVLALLETEVS